MLSLIVRDDVFRTHSKILDGVFYLMSLTITIFAKRFILNVWLVSKIASDCYHYVLKYVPLLESYSNWMVY